jgi:RNA polymerase sigma-70 factor, ECF subfamily
MTIVTEDLVRAFVQGLPAERRAEVAGWPHLGQVLAAALNEARRTWPSIDLEPELYAVHLAERLFVDRSIEASLQALHTTDLYIACACCTGSVGAIEALEHAYSARLRGVIARIDEHDTLRDDVGQELRRKLFVGSEATQPAIVRYAGHGPLGAWLVVSATRTTLNALRDRDARDTTRGCDELFGSTTSVDPELQYLKGHYREHFREAFFAAIADLSTEQRNLLRLSVVHRLTVRQIGRMLDIHHATAARRIAQARQELVAVTRRHLAMRLKLSGTELESIMKLIASQVQASIVKVLGEHGSAPDAGERSRGS